jgi:nickel-dependent lactate racemase
MDPIIRYGTDSTIMLDAPEEVPPTMCDAPRGEPLDDVAAAVAAALVEPIEFPQIAQATLPDDRVAIALADDVPQADAVVAGIVHVLLENGIAADHITIVQTAHRAAQGDSPATALPKNIRELVTVVAHDPRDRDRIALLGTSVKNDAPIYFCREIVDAEMVIPVGCLRPSCTPGYSGAAESLYPLFADEEGQKRFRDLDAIDSPESIESQRQVSEEAAWTLGVLLAVVLVPGDDGQILHVLAGRRDLVAESAMTLCNAAWATTIANQADLVIAAITGPPGEQTWDNVGRALAAALAVVADDGAIIVCSTLSEPPGAALQLVAGEPDFLSATREIGRTSSPDAIPALWLIRAVEASRVYFVSDLSEGDVEALGMIPVPDAEDVARLASRYRFCVVLANAQRAVVTLEESEVDAS